MHIGRPGRTLAPQPSTLSTGSSGLPPDLLAQSARRLHIQALLYGFAFFIAALFPSLILSDARTHLLSSPLRWIPPVASLTLAATVAVLTRRKEISPEAIMRIAPVFQILGSLGIAAAEFLDASTYAMDPPWSGLSWVAIWVLGFSVLVPSPPRRTLVTAIASFAMIPLVVAIALATQPSPVEVGFRTYFFLVLPHVVVVVIAYVCARVIYRIGSALSHARQLGSYRLIEQLGGGGMGQVWRAEHRLLARPAAIKLMNHDVAGRETPHRQAEFMARFEREAQATALLQSPHTVDLYDFGIAEDGALYYVMELLDGFDLQTLVTRFGPLPPERVVWLLKQMCHSLGEAHADGLVHRDIKPANVYTCRHGRDTDFVKVLDFGLVKSNDPHRRTELDLSGLHAVGGTPSFMAPEQAQGTGAINHRTDIYATGCVAYWLLTGTRVFDGETNLQLMIQHIQAAPVAPSARVEYAMPPGMDEVVMACLEKDPARRPASADELLMRLEGVRLAETWTERRRNEWWQVHAPAART